jgi:hypothetical protein
MRVVITGLITTSAVVAAATLVQAQTLVADEIRAPYPRSDVIIEGRGPYAALPPAAMRGGSFAAGGYDDALPPFEVVRMIRRNGFEPLGAPVRRRFVYTISAINPDGYDGRVVVDARSGRLVRFIPAEVTDAEVVGAYGPPGLPPPDLMSPPPQLQRMNARTSLRPPASVPHVVLRKPPAAAAKPDPRPIGAATSQPTTVAQARPPEAKAVESKPAPAAPVDAKPTLQLQPTQEMPPVQGLE